MDELSESRKTISEIDERIVPLFVQRMEAVRRIAQYKYDHGLPIEDKEQEARIMAERSAHIEDDELRPFFSEFFQNTMDVSKSWQRHLIRELEVNCESIEEDSRL